LFKNVSFITLYFKLKIVKVAITGASGHIGNCLVRRLIQEGAQIKVLVHEFRNGLDELDVELVQGDLLDLGSLLKLCEGADVVFHLAARITIDNRSSEQVYNINVTGTENIVKAAISSGVKKFIHFSSIDAFKTESPDMNFDESRGLIETKEAIYRFTKAEGERVVMRASKEGLNAVIINPSAVIGPFDSRGSLLGKALLSIYQNKLPFLVSGGYNWVDVRDVVAAAVHAIGSGRSGEKYILSGTFCTLKELSFMINKISGSRIPYIVPVLLARLTCPFFQVYSAVTNTIPIYTNQSLDLLVSSPANISSEKAFRELGYEPRPLEQTLRDTFDWYKANKYLS
jgi:dihydroflavonol-4-reductase